LEIFSGTVSGETKRPQIPLSEREAGVWDLQCSEPKNGRKKVLKGAEYPSAMEYVTVFTNQST
jgi:hypothetical protein